MGAGSHARVGGIFYRNLDPEETAKQLGNRCALNANPCGALDAKKRDTSRAQKRVPMKATRKFKSSWFLAAIVVAILVGEIVAWEVSNRFGVRSNPLVVAFLCTGIVAAITSVLYEGADIG